MALEPDVTDLLYDPDLGAQVFQIKRRTVSWQGGRTSAATEEMISATGIIQPPSPEALQFFPEGERRNGMIVIYTTTMMYLSDGQQISDVVTWQGENYRIIRVDRWDDYGFCTAYGAMR